MLRGYKCLISRKILDIIIKRGLVKAPGCFLSETAIHAYVLV
jgi:hypothetical protein